MQTARKRGIERIELSTQAQNIAVQRAWAGLGFKPIRPLDTTHLVRNELLR